MGFRLCGLESVVSSNVKLARPSSVSKSSEVKMSIGVARLINTQYLSIRRVYMFFGGYIGEGLTTTVVENGNPIWAMLKLQDG